MAEKDLEGKLEQDRKITDATIGQSRAGLFIAASLSVIALGASVGFFAVGDTIAGGILLGMPVAVLIKSFIDGSTGGGGKAAAAP